MAFRSSMAALVDRVRLLTNDTDSTCQQFTDEEIQQVLDASRLDVRYLPLKPAPSYSGASIVFLDYYAPYGDWEDDATFWYVLTTQVTPSVSEPIAGHWQFAISTLPPVSIIGKSYDIYHAAADLLERQAARWVLKYNMSVEGQSLQRSQAATALQNLAKTYRLQQRAQSMDMARTDLNTPGTLKTQLGPTTIDYLATGEVSR